MRFLGPALFLLASSSASAFVTAPVGQNSRHSNNDVANLQMSTHDDAAASTRRSFLAYGIGGAITGAFVFQQSALAIPLVTVDEFDIILRDSPLSVEVVEFSGQKSETVTVKLVDGTSFGIKDIVESSTDPRSPLKVSAACRESGVKTKFVDLEALLSKSGSKKKLYTNQRVQDAAAKTRAQQERMRQDEEDRIAALKRMEQTGQ